MKSFWSSMVKPFVNPVMHSCNIRLYNNISLHQIIIIVFTCILYPLPAVYHGWPVLQLVAGRKEAYPCRAACGSRKCAGLQELPPTWSSHLVSYIPVISGFARLIPRLGYNPPSGMSHYSWELVSHGFPHCFSCEVTTFDKEKSCHVARTSFATCAMGSCICRCWPDVPGTLGTDSGPFRAKNPPQMGQPSRLEEPSMLPASLSA